MTNKKKIVVFSGAGLDRESGILTFRDCKDGLWNNYKIDEVATPEGWDTDNSKVLDFYNQRRSELPTVKPNEAHRALLKLEEDYEVVHITQNVSDLLERAGCSDVYHLHGELTKARTSFGMRVPNLVRSQPVIDIGYNEINVGDFDEDGYQLRPHIVWFNEYPFHVEKAYQAFRNADIVLIVGTSLNITYTISFFNELKPDAKVYYVDPEPSLILNQDIPIEIEYIVKKAGKGVSKLVKKLVKEAIKDK